MRHHSMMTLPCGYPNHPNTQTPFTCASQYTAMQRMAHDSGECATAGAAASNGALMTLSSWSTTSLEDVAKAGGPGGARWFQLYVYKVRFFFFFSSTYTRLICLFPALMCIHYIHKMSIIAFCPSVFLFGTIVNSVVSGTSMRY